MLCMHTPPAAWRPARLAAGCVVRGVVVCVHPFGLGVYLPDVHDFGHVNVPEFLDGPTETLPEYPAVGEQHQFVVLGRSGVHDQLRLGNSRRGQTFDT